MILRVGTWYSNRNSALHSVLLESVVAESSVDPEFGAPITIRRFLSVLVHLEDFASQAAVKTAIQTLETALATDGPDVIMYHDIDSDSVDPTVESAHHLKATQQGNLDRIGSPVLQSVEWLPGVNAQYASRRSVRLVFFADYEGFIQDGTIIRFRESVTYQGFGGAIKLFSQPMTGYPTKVQLQQRTQRYAIQRGTALAWGQWVGYSAPLWPTLYDDGPGSGLTNAGAERVNGENKLFGSQWEYIHSGAENNPIVALWPQP